MSNFYTESFQDFANKLGPTDIALYAGAGLVLWILFKDKMSPVQNFISSIIDKVKNKQNMSTSMVLTKTDSVTKNKPKDDVFFKLVTSWKQTRDLAVLSGCDKAVEVADQMFPFLSPTVCEEKEVSTNE